MTTVLPFANNAIPVFAYEGFDYTISNLNPSFTLQNVSNTTGLNPTSLYFTKDGNDSYRFSISDASTTVTPGTTESFTLRTVDGSGNVYTSSNIVSIGAGRFLDASGVSLSNTSYTFFKNEAISATLGRPLRLVAPFTLKPPTSIPALPPGLSFVSNASNIYDIAGVPLTTVPNSNYQIIGIQDGGSKIVTTRINMVISNERLRLNLSGSSIINNMQIGVPITSRVITSIPPIGSGNIQYSFPSLPNGIVARDIFGNIQPSPFTAVDPSYTLIVDGTPTLNAAVTFKNAGITTGGSNITVRASRFSPSLLENSQAITFSFGETVLFDTPTISNNYVGIPVDPSLNFFRATTNFTSNVPISNIFSPDLRSDLSLVFVPSLSRANLTGTPSNTGSASYTIRAVNSNGISNDIQQTISISNDFVTFSSPVGVDLCYNFILSRPLTQFKPGYYESNIQFVATAGSGRAVTLSAPVLSGTGLSLSNGTIVGLPTTVTPLTDLVVTATVSGSPATATKTVKFAIVNDTFTFGDVSASSLTFVENVPITPFRIPVTTLSDRNIINYSLSGFPSGVNINPAGVVSGTPLSSSPTAGNGTITTSTGYASGSRDYSYNITPDSMLFIVNPKTYTYRAGDPVGTINIDAVTYSGTTVSNYDLSMTPTYGLTINPVNGVVSGTWTTGIPPATLLPSSCNFAVTALANSLVGVFPAQFTANPIVDNVMLFGAYGNPTGSGDFSNWLYYTRPTNVSSFINTGIVSSNGITDIQFKNNNPATNVFMATTSGGQSSSGNLYRGTALANITIVNLDPDAQIYPILSKVVYKSGTSTWWVGGRFSTIAGSTAATLRSDDDGLTWDTNTLHVISNSSSKNIRTRDGDGNFSGWSRVYDPYLYGGIGLAYKNGVLMAGGLCNDPGDPIMLRSSDDGNTWTNVSGEFSTECANFSLDHPTVWVATGSDAYRSVDIVNSIYYNGSTNTIKYSIDNGSNWSNASGGFTMFGYEIVYANNTWLATGVKASGGGGPPAYFVPEIRYSTNGSNWSVADLSTNDLFNPSNQSNIVAPLRIGSMNFDGNYWNVLVNVEPQVSGGGAIPTLYRHDASSSLASGWFAVDISSSLVSGQPDVTQNLRYLAYEAPTYLFTDDPPIDISLSFITTPSGVGPTFTSPTTRSFIQYQYIAIQPIQISATGSGQVYFFVETQDLPPGLTFDRLTNQISGTPATAGRDTATIYAKDNSGVSSITLDFTTIVPRIVRKQDGAGAYTSLLRQYTEVLGAQNARDSRVFPNQERALGEFMSPEAPDVITQTVDPKCFDPRCLQ